ncbi:MAG: T9SS type A sorting domain-containing protein [Bacteroidales bacterium]|nr:T9SS type A sorting domain-containing protein [Bacteroidales bacterium]
MIAFNTLDNTLYAGYVPSLVSEIICDNYSFARSAYSTTSIPEFELAVFSISPNPASSKFTVKTDDSEEASSLKIRDMSGRLYLSMNIQQPETEIYTDQLGKGLYVVTLQNSKGTKNQKLIIQ